MITRSFLLTPALARLVRGHRGSTSIAEGFFEQQGRMVFVRIKGRETHLVLSTPRDGKDAKEDAAKIPSEHALLLMGSCAGRVSFEQSSLMLTDGQEVLVRRYNGLTALAMASVTFPNRDTAERFAIPVWFGSEVTGDGAYTNRGLALGGLPRLDELSISDPALNAVMDLFDKQPKPAREHETEAMPQEAAELSEDMLLALTEGMERAIAGAAEDVTADGSAEEPQPVHLPTPHVVRPEGGVGRVRNGYAAARGFRRHEQAQDAAAAS